MRKFLYASFIPLLLVGVMLTPSAHAETTTTNNDATVAKIQALMTQLAEMQKQFAALQGEIKEVLASGLKEGSTSDDVKRIQEILATDSTIYPEGKVTGYFGPMTKEAIMRFQKRHELTMTGIVDDETKAFLEGYMEERSRGNNGKEMLGTGDMMKRVEDRVRIKCDTSGKGSGVGPLCERLKLHKDKNDEDDEDGEDENDDDVVTLKEATKAIRDANKAIFQAVREINKANGDTAEAEALLADAKRLVSEAITARNERDFGAALAKAEKSDETAENARELAKNSDESKEEDEDEYNGYEDDEDDEDDEEDEDDLN